MIRQIDFSIDALSPRPTLGLIFYLNDSEHNDNDKEEKRDIKSESEVKVLISRRLKFVTDSTTGSNTCIEMELCSIFQNLSLNFSQFLCFSTTSEKSSLEAGEHVVALVVILAVLALVVVALEEVEGQDRVEVYDNRQQANCQHKLLSIVGD